MDVGKPQLLGARIAIDIGSTVVKVARVAEDGALAGQSFHPRDFRAGIARQVDVLLDGLGSFGEHDDVLVCSSAMTEVSFDTAQVARYIKIVLRAPSTNWLSINEINVVQ